MHETAAIILAAGQGKRMKASVPKPLVPLDGVPIVQHLLDAVEAAGVQQIAVVVGHGSDMMRSHLGERYLTPEQTTRNGTAHAVKVAQPSVGNVSEVMVLVGDSPLIRASSLRKLQEVHRETGAACSFLTANFARHFPYARVFRGQNGQVTACIEERDCTPAQANITEYLTSHFLFDAPKLWKQIDNVPTHPTTGERYLTDVIGLLISAGERVEAVSIDDWRELVGLNTPEDVAWAAQVRAHG